MAGIVDIESFNRWIAEVESRFPALYLREYTSATLKDSLLDLVEGLKVLSANRELIPDAIQIILFKYDEYCTMRDEREY